MRLRFLVLAFSLLFVGVAVKPAYADGIVFEGVSNGKYSYGLDVTSLITMPFRSEITFTGLSGVTGASDSLPDLFRASFTANSATFTVKFFPGLVFPRDIHDLFTITSTAPLGTVNYSIAATFRDIEGPVAGPNGVAVTPEPSSWALLATGLMGMVLVMRRYPHIASGRAWFERHLK